MLPAAQALVVHQGVGKILNLVRNTGWSSIVISSAIDLYILPVSSAAALAGRLNISISVIRKEVVAICLGQN